MVEEITVLRHVDQVEKGVASGVVAAEVDAAVAAQVAEDRQHQLVAVPVHAADAGLLEGGGEAAGAAAVETDYIDAAGGFDLRGIDAHRLADRNRLGHRGFDDCGAVSQRRIMIGRISADQTSTMD